MNGPIPGKLRMTESNGKKPERLEDLLTQVQGLERAGVFNRTPVDPAAMMRDAGTGSRSQRMHRLFVALQAAACLALIVGVLSLWGNGDGPQNMVGTGTTDTRVACADPGVLATCMNGPASAGLTGECECVDLDADGDVDLADYGALQRSSASRR